MYVVEYLDYKGQGRSRRFFQDAAARGFFETCRVAELHHYNTRGMRLLERK